MQTLLTPREFRELGEALYGRTWRAHMAARLGKTKRTIERYADGSRRVPSRLRDELDDLIEQQIRTLSGFWSVNRDQDGQATTK